MSPNQSSDYPDHSSTQAHPLISPKFWLAGLAVLLALAPQPVQAQVIQAAPDGTGTVVNLNGNQFNITGGTLSGDKANLFHSFSQFGLSQGQIATFLSNPNIQNILSRVNSNNPSIINGLLQVSGSNANLYLINPSGIIFGPNASLNVPAAFIATTANGVQFGNNQWFSATGSNNFASLNGNPTALAFTMNQPGGIINAGNLSVGPGQQVALVGGTVINTGTISTPGGEVTVTAVPGQSAVRLSSPGTVLSLEVPLLPSASQPNQLQLPPLSLAELLTGSQAAGVNTGVAALPGGQVQVAGTTLTVPNGTALVSGQISTLNPQGNGGTVQILGQNVGLLSANLNASGQTGGGRVLIGGDYLGQGSTPTALRTYIDPNSRITADALGQWGSGDCLGQ
jgi:filamentous hemagglutinin family protein